MVTLPTGKGAWIWKYIDSVDVVASNVQKAGLGHVFIKIADGVYQYGASYPRQELVNKLKAIGVQVWGWAYTYGGALAAREAELAARLVIDLGLDGFVINAEREYKGNPTAATTYARTLRMKLPARPIGLSTYRYPEVHGTFPFKQFRQYIDFDAPQVYWVQAHNPVMQLEESMEQYARMLPLLPCVPSGAAWKDEDWGATGADVKAFIGAAKKAECSGCTMWEYNQAIQDGLWDAIASVPWEVVPPPAPGPLDPRVEALERWSEATNVVLKNHDDRIVKLENKPVVSYAMPFAWFVPEGGSCVIQRVTKWNRTSSGIDRPIYAPVGDGAHPKINGKARVFPLPLTGDGGMTCYMLLDQTINGETVYVRRQDGNLQ